MAVEEDMFEVVVEADLYSGFVKNFLPLILGFHYYRYYRNHFSKLPMGDCMLNLLGPTLFRARN